MIDSKIQTTAEADDDLENILSTKSGSGTELLEQYKLFVTMTDKVSARRIEANKFYMAWVTGTLAVISIVITTKPSWEDERLVFVLGAILGIIVCLAWVDSVYSYKQLNSAKFRVIHMMEERLPFQCYVREWEILQGRRGFFGYTRLTNAELYVPVMLALGYLALLVYALAH